MAHRRYGPADALVNCAGVFPGETTLDFDWAVYDRVIQVNLTAPIEAVRAWLHQLPPQVPGTIVNVSSAAARRGSQDISYAASKAGLLGATRSLARLLADRRVAAFAVAPGIVDTPMARVMTSERRTAVAEATLLGREASPEEVADLIVYLIVHRPAYMTGITLPIDGGLTT
jgi:3-oxoacyl-[acyl-carrier protein] reductase